MRKEVEPVGDGAKQYKDPQPNQYKDDPGRHPENREHDDRDVSPIGQCQRDRLNRSTLGTMVSKAQGPRNAER